MNFKETYIHFLRGFLDLQRPLKVVFDFSNGPTASVVPRLVRGYRLMNPAYLDRRLSGNFPGHGPNPMAGRGIMHLHREVLRRGADLGVIFDADGDRAFFVDGRGRWVPPHVVAHLLFHHHRPPYVADQIVATTLGKADPFTGQHLHRSRVGSYFVKQLMRRIGASVGVEYSGHHYFKDFFYVDAGIFSAIKVMGAVSRLPYALADYVDLLPKQIYAQLINIRTTEPKHVVERITRQFRPRARSASQIDGVTIDFGAWWLTARPSNTEPLVRVFIGAYERGELKRATVAVRRTIR